MNQAVALFERVSDKAPGALYDLVLALNAWGKWLSDNGRQEEAEPLLSKAETVRQELGIQFPHVLQERHAADHSGPTVDFKVRITTPGEYQLYVRQDAHDVQSDRFSVWIEELADGPGGTIADTYGFVCYQDWDFDTNPWDGTAAFESTNEGVDIDCVWAISSPGDFTLRFGGDRDGAALDAVVFQRSNIPAPSGDGP